MKSIGFLSIKGGCGKSSLAILTANMLAQQGFRTLYIDADVQNSGTFYYLPKPTETNNKNLARALMTGNLLENITHSNGHIPDIIASSFSLLKLRALSICTLSSCFDQLSHRYDVVVIDTAPTLDNIVLNVANAVDVIVTPCLPSSFDWKSAIFLRDQLRLELGAAAIDKWHILRNRWKVARSGSSPVAQYDALFSRFNSCLPSSIPDTSVIKKLIDFSSNLTKSKVNRPVYDAIKSLILESIGLDINNKKEGIHE